MQRVTFQSGGNELVGHLHVPDGGTESTARPAIVVSGSWTTVKEQMAGSYARLFAAEGFITLAFDFTGYGESPGQPMYYESPRMKIEDIKAAVRYLAQRPDVDEAKIGAFGVCAGAAYTLVAAAEDAPIGAVVTAASWLHDEEATKMFYGGEEGVRSKMEAAEAAAAAFEATGDVAYIPTISDTDESAAMFGPYDYYLNPERGAIPAWSADKFAVMSWKPWLTFDATTAAGAIKKPVMMIHSDGAVLPDYTRKFFDAIPGAQKELVWMDTELQSPFHQFSFYDQEAEMSAVVENGARWFKAAL